VINETGPVLYETQDEAEETIEVLLGNVSSASILLHIYRIFSNLIRTIFTVSED